MEKVGIRIADAPFVAVEMTATEREGGQVLTFRTNVGDVVEAGPEHPLRFVIAGGNSELKPYLLVRGRLEALVICAADAAGGGAEEVARILPLPADAGGENAQQERTQR